MHLIKYKSDQTTPHRWLVLIYSTRNSDAGLLDVRANYSHNNPRNFIRIWRSYEGETTVKHIKCTQSQFKYILGRKSPEKLVKFFAKGEDMAYSILGILIPKFWVDYRK